MDEDDDVIVEGTCIYEYLQNAGFTDFEAVSSHNKYDESGKILSNRSNIKKLEKAAPIMKKTGYDFVTRLLNNLSGMFNNNKSNFVNSVSMEIIQTKLLQETDLLILESLSPTVGHFASDQQYLNALQVDQPLSLNISTVGDASHILFLVCIWCLLGVVIVPTRMIWQISWLSYLVVFTLVSTSAFLIRWKFIRKYKIARNALKRLLHIIQDCSSLSGRCLLLLNELCIIKKGIARKAGTLEDSEFCYESGVSKNVFELLESLSLMLSFGHGYIERFTPTELEDVVETFAGRFKANQSKTSEDCFLYSSLKIRRKHVKEQISALLVEMLLCFEYSEDLSIFHLIPPNELKAIEKRVKFLERRLCMSKKFWLKEESQLMRILKPLKSFERIKTDVVGAVDALSIHCRIIAYSGMYLKNMMEEGKANSMSPSYDCIELNCDEIKNEIMSCSACLEEVLERSKSLLCDRDNMPLSRDKTLENGYKSEEHVEDTNTKLYGLEDPVIEDEVFEAIVDSCTMGDIDVRNEIWFESVKKERRVKKKQKERWKRVLQEVQPILLQRREMWREREEEALRRKAAVDKESKPPPPQKLLKPPECVENCLAYKLGSDKISNKMQYTDSGGDSGVNSPDDGSYPVTNASLTSELLHLHLETSVKDAEQKISDKRSVASAIPIFDVEEYDSEEERLLLYQRVRKELDEDEARRGSESDDGSDTESENESISELKIKMHRENFLPERMDAFSRTFSIPGMAKNCSKPSFQNDPVLSSTDKSHMKEDEEEICSDNINFDSRLRETRESLDPRLRKPRESFQKMNDYHPSQQESKIFSPNTTCLDRNANSKSVFEQEQIGHSTQPSKENFSCGESSSDDEQIIDWSSCSFAGRKAEDESVVPAFGMSLPDLPSVVSSENWKRLPVLRAGEEVFGGVGEGETETESEDEVSES